MPEIPEMENYKTLLTRTVAGKTITGVEITRPATVNILPAEFIYQVKGQQIREIKRTGKYLIFTLQNSNHLLLHLMLDGWLYLVPVGDATSPAPDAPAPDAQVIMNIENAGTLYFCELHLGFLHWHNDITLHDALNDLGEDPLAPEFTEGKVSSILAKRKGAIHPLLINQKVIAGIGNGYSNEILFHAAILPDRPAKDLQPEETRKLHSAIPAILRKGITSGGYMEHPFTPGDTHTGGMNRAWQVYDRARKPCYICGTKIEKKVLSGRNVFYCPVCQK